MVHTTPAGEIAVIGMLYEFGPFADPLLHQVRIPHQWPDLNMSLTSAAGLTPSLFLLSVSFGTVVGGPNSSPDTGQCVCGDYPPTSYRWERTILQVQWLFDNPTLRWACDMDGDERGTRVPTATPLPSPHGSRMIILRIVCCCLGEERNGESTGVAEDSRAWCTCGVWSFYHASDEAFCFLHCLTIVFHQPSFSQKDNARPVQPINGRNVYMYEPPHEDHARS